MPRLPALLAALMLAAPALAGDPPVTGTEWTLLAIDGQPATALATLVLEADGRVTGQAPCNRYSTQSRAALPALAFGPIGATRMACDALKAEADYFAALQAMTAAELRDGHLILTGAEGHRLEFYRPEVEDKPHCASCPKAP